jgi:hypothetical protein
MSIQSKHIIKIDVSKTKLDEVFIILHKKYGVQLSYDNNLISKYKLSLNQEFKTVKNAISAITKKLGLKYEIINEVFIISKDKNYTPQQKKHIYSGQLIDPTNNEPLPYSSIQLSFGHLIADASGKFAFETLNDKEELKISHIGYYKLDTIIKPTTNQKIYLKPSQFEIDEIVVKSINNVYDIHIGQTAGLIKLNHKLAKLLPGNNNNTIYNLLRLQPGVLANSEYGGGFNIWGSQRGDNFITFDGITIFNSSSLDSEIGIINPLLVKDIELHRSGFSANKADVTGGAIEIIGKNGNNKQHEFQINASSRLINGMANLKLGDKTHLFTAFRTTYNKQIDWEEILNQESDKSYDSDFKFSDMNFKIVSSFFHNDKIELNFIKNWDDETFSLFNYDEDIDVYKNEISKKQTGFSTQYKLNFNKLGDFTLTYSLSKLSTNNKDIVNQDINTENNFEINEGVATNSIQQQKIKLLHNVSIYKHNYTQYGIEILENEIDFKEGDEDNFKQLSTHYNLFIDNRYSITNNWDLNTGLRINYLSEIEKKFIQPRISSQYRITKNLKINLSLGLYNQYFSESSFFNDIGNKSYYWILHNDEEHPIIESKQISNGILYNLNNWTLNLNTYIKEIDGKVQYRYNSYNQLFPAKGKTFDYGLNLFIKRRIRQHNFWMSYSLSKSEEQFEPTKKIINQPNDQRHEIKLVSLLNFHPFYVSSNYVYGSGLEFTKVGNKIKEYSRLDIAFLYKFYNSYINLESGISILNLLNQNNISINGLTYDPYGKETFTEGIPFTPSIFLNLKF